MNNVKNNLENEVMFINDIGQFKLQLLYGIKLSSYVFVHIIKGSASFCVNDNHYELQVNDLFVCHPDIKLENTFFSLQTELNCTVISPESVEDMAILATANWDIRLYMDQNFVLHLSDEDARICSMYFELMKNRNEKANPQHRHVLVKTLIQAFIYEFHGIIQTYIDMPKRSISSSDNLFRRFRKLVDNTHPVVREVSFYAECLNITTKYLSVACKRACGKCPSEIITTAAVKEIESALRNTALSVKEIAHIMKFPNESFCCAYVKKHLHATPYGYRRQYESFSSEIHV